MIGEYLRYRRLRALHALSSERVWIDQVLGLRALMKRLFDVPFYGDRLRKAGTKPGDLRTVKDLAMMPATSAAAFAEELRRRAGARAAGATALAFDASGRVAPVSLGADARARRLHLFAVLTAWRVALRDRVVVAGSGFGEEEAPGAIFFRVARARVGADAGRVARDVVIVDAGASGDALAARGRGATSAPGRVVIARGAPVPYGVVAALAGAEPHASAAPAPRAILGDALFGPIAWQCSSGAFHPVAARAVIEAVTGESAARGLTGGSRSSRAPREAGALHITLLEDSALPVFRIELGLRGRILPAGCACGALTNRLELETPFLGPLLVGDAGAPSVLDPLAILHAAASAAAPVTRVALIQDDARRLRLLAAIAGEGEPGLGAPAGTSASAAEAAIRAGIARLELPRGVAIEATAGAEAALPFPERGYVRGLSHGPLVAAGAAVESEPLRG